MTSLLRCDLCLVVGTSSVVYPAAMFAPQVPVVSVCLSFCMSVCLFVCLSVCLFVRLSFSFSYFTSHFFSSQQHHWPFAILVCISLYISKVAMRGVPVAEFNLESTPATNQLGGHGFFFRKSVSDNSRLLYLTMDYIFSHLQNKCKDDIHKIHRFYLI